MGAVVGSGGYAPSAITALFVWNMDDNSNSNLDEARSEMASRMVTRRVSHVLAWDDLF